MNNIKILTVLIASSLMTFSLSSQALGYGGPPEQSSAGNYTVKMYSDQESYSVGDPILLSGTVNKYSEDRNLQITVFDSARNLILNEKISVNPDATFSYEVVLDEKSKDGKYTVRGQYGTSKVTIEKISFMVNLNGSSSAENSLDGANIPAWIKNNAGWWAEGEIDDDSFIQGIQFLIKEGMMTIPVTEEESTHLTNEIPAWIKNNAGWWAEGEIDDDSFIQGIQFLIKEGMMSVST